MTDDIERRLRELFDDKATDTAAAQRAPEPVIKRARRREFASVAVIMVTVLALAGVSFAGIRNLNGHDQQGLMPADIDPYASGRYPIFERTARIESLEVTSPSDWYLVNQWPLGSRIATQVVSYGCDDSVVAVPVGASGSYGATGSYGASGTYGNDVCTASPSPEADVGALPVLQLSNRDFGLTMPACGLGGTSPMTMTGDDAVMGVVIDPSVISNGQSLSDTTDPGDHLAIDGSGEPDDDLCGAGYYRKFVVEGIPFVAWASFGPDVSEEDRAVALDALALASTGSFGSDPNTQTPAYVLAGGDGWRLDLHPTAGGNNVDLELQYLFPEGSALFKYGSGTIGNGNFTVPAVPIEDCCPALRIGGPGNDASQVRFGAVTQEASGVEFHPSDDGAAVPGTLVPLPPSLMQFPFDLYFVDSGWQTGKVVPLGLEAEPTPTPSEAPLPSVSPSQTPPAVGPTPQPRVNSVDGDGLGMHWKVSTIVHSNGKGCVYLTIDDLADSAEECGDPSTPVVAIHRLDDGVILFGVVPEAIGVEWEVDQWGADVATSSGSLVASVDDPDPAAGIPFAVAIPETEGRLVVHFVADGASTYPDWQFELSPDPTP